MAEIYTKAHQVIAWLGIDDGTYKHIIHIHTTFLRDIRVDLENGSRLTASDDGLSVNNKSISAEALQALYSFWSTRRYFARAWIVQEIGVRPASILLNGALISVDAFADMAAYVGSAWGAWRYQQHLNETFSDGKELVWLRDIRGVMNLSHQYHITNALIGTGDAAYFRFMCWAFSGPHRRTTDPRDALYSLHGMVAARTKAAPFLPDYTLQDPFLLFTTAALQHSLQILSLCNGGSPSWVPQFNERLRPLDGLFRLFWGQEPTFKACSDELAVVRVEGRALHITGRRCTTIRQCAALNAGDLSHSAPFASTALTALELLQDCPRSIDITESLFRTIHYSSHIDGGPNAASFRQTIITAFLSIIISLARSTDRSHDVTLRSILAKMEGIPGLPTSSEIAQCIIDALTQQPEHLTESARLLDVPNQATNLQVQLWYDDYVFACENNLFGRIVGHVQPGDELWLLCGAKVPFVLRPLQGVYRIVGQAFVHGAMYGELLAELARPAANIQQIRVV